MAALSTSRTKTTENLSSIAEEFYRDPTTQANRGDRKTPTYKLDQWKIKEADLHVIKGNDSLEETKAKLRRNERRLDGKVQPILGIDPTDILKAGDMYVDVIVRTIGQSVEATIKELKKSVVNKNEWTKLENQLGFLRNVPTIRGIFNEDYETACSNVKKAYKNMANLKDGGDSTKLQEALDKAEEILLTYAEKLAEEFSDEEKLMDTIMDTERRILIKCKNLHIESGIQELDNRYGEIAGLEAVRTTLGQVNSRLIEICVTIMGGDKPHDDQHPQIQALISNMVRGVGSNSFEQWALQNYSMEGIFEKIISIYSVGDNEVGVHDFDTLLDITVDTFQRLIAQAENLHLGSLFDVIGLGANELVDTYLKVFEKKEEFE